MKLRKPKPTKVKVKDKNGKWTGEVIERPTSYHEISIPDTIIKSLKWIEGEEINPQCILHEGDKKLVLTNTTQQSYTVEFKTMS